MIVKGVGAWLSHAQPRIGQSYLGRREGSAQSMLAQISRGGSTRPATLPVSVRNCVRGPPLAEPDQARRTLQEPVGDRGGHHGVAEHLAPLAVAGPLVGIGGVPVVTGPILKMWLPNELEQLGTAFSTACPPPLCCLGDRDRGQPVENAPRCHRRRAPGPATRNPQPSTKASQVVRFSLRCREETLE